MKRTELSEQECGSLLLEFAIVIPVILIIAFSGLDISRAMRLQQMAQTLSREAASRAYRDCAVQPGTRTTDKLNLTQSALQTEANNLLPGSTVVLSMYSYDPAGGSITVYGPSGGASKYTLTALNTSGNPVGDYIRSHRVAVIAEISTPYASFVGTSRFLFSLGQKVIYDVSIV